MVIQISLRIITQGHGLLQINIIVCWVVIWIPWCPVDRDTAFQWSIWWRRSRPQRLWYDWRRLSWNVTLCGLLEIYWCLGGMYCLPILIPWRWQ